MKKIFCFLSISLLLTHFLLAQNNSTVGNSLKEMNNDTLLYLKQQILNQKNTYIGKPMDSILKNLPATIKEYSNGDNSKNRSLCNETSFYFFPIRETPKRIVKKQDPLLIIITWATPLDTKEMEALGLAKMFSGKWNQVAYTYFKNKIVSNIKMVEFNYELK